MTMEIPRAMLSRKDLTHGEKSTMTALYLYAYTGKTEVFPSNQTLAEATAQTPHAVQKHLLKFDTIGLVTREHDGVKRVITLWPQGRPTSDERSPTSDERSPHLSPGTPPPLTSGPLHIRNQPKNQPSEDSRPKGQPLAANNAQLSLSEMSRLTTELPKPPSGREVWVKRLWGIFTSLHHQVQDRLIEAGAAKRRSDFTFRTTYKRMLGTLYRENYSEENLGDAWIEMAKNAEDQQSLKYFRPSTCFVAKNINRSLEDRVNDDAQDPQEIAEVADPG